MPCTHIIEVHVGSIDLEGELDFECLEDDGTPTLKFRLTGTIENTLHQRAILQQLFVVLRDLHQHCGEITKIEVVPK